MLKKNKNNKLPAVFRSAMALSLASVGIFSSPFLGKSFLHTTSLPVTKVFADQLPTLNGIYYDDQNKRFQDKTGFWHEVSGNQYVSSMVSNFANGSSFDTYTDRSEGLVLFKIDTAPVNASYVLRINGISVISGTVQKFTVQGQSCYGVYVSASTMKKTIKLAAQTGATPVMNFTNIPHVESVGFPIRNVQVQAHLVLPSPTFTEDMAPASSVVDGKVIRITDQNGSTITAVALKKEWLTFDRDDNKPGVYPYHLNQTGIQAIQNLLNKIQPNHNLSIVYTLDSPEPATVTICSKDKQVSLVISYVDENQKTVTSETITGAVGTHGTYHVNVPAGYQLATGQSKVIEYTLSDKNKDNITIRIVKDTSDNSSGTTSSDSSSSSNNSNASSDSSSTSDNSNASSSSSSTSDNSNASSSSSSTSDNSNASNSSSSTSDNSNTSSDNSSSNNNSSAHSENPTHHYPRPTVPKGNATITLVDDGTGSVINQVNYQGDINSSIPIDVSDLLLNAIRAGYNIVSNPIIGQDLRFTENPQIFEIHLRKNQAMPFSTETQTTQDNKKDSRKKMTNKNNHSKTKSNVEELTNQTRIHQDLNENNHKNHRSRNNQKSSNHTPPIAMENSGINLSSHGGAGGGGNGGPNDPDLGAFFTAIAGLINLTQSR